MIQHYIKIAFRNLWKYKTQTAISIIGLAVGFTCFSLATLWIRYETSFDSFYPDSDRIYMIRKVDDVRDSYGNRGAWKNGTPQALPFYLRKHCPEAELITSFDYNPEDKTNFEIKVGEKSFNKMLMIADTAFIEMFNVKAVSGNIQELFLNEMSVALTEKAAKEMFEGTNPIGQTINRFGMDLTIVAVVKDFAGPSNFSFDILAGDNGAYKKDTWLIGGGITFIKFHKNVNIEAFVSKIATISVSEDWYVRNLNFEIIPITSVREKSPFADPQIRHHHIYLFAVSGALLIICCLFNYLTLFLSRFRIRRREFAIRMVNGSSIGSLFNLLFIEFVFVLIISYAIGLVMTDSILLPFQKLSQIDIGLLDIYKETFLYTTGVILFSILLFVATLFFFRKDAISASVRKTNNRFYRKASIVIQLVISIGFIFCTSIMVRQLWYLHNTDIGFEYKNIAIIRVGNPSLDYDEWQSQVRKVPGVVNAIAGFSPIFPATSSLTMDLELEGVLVQLEIFYGNEAFLELYKFRLIKGEMLKDTDPEGSCVVTETAARALGIVNLGVQTAGIGGNVKGIIEDIHNSLPTAIPKPIILQGATEHSRYSNRLVFVYEGDWKTMKNNIEKCMKEDYPNKWYELTNCQEAYNDFFRAEEALLTILGFVSIVCIAISLFGFVSLISLTCEERRKEIAIRKVNGATVTDILSIFFKEYSLLLAIGAAIAFPVAYYLMKMWLMQYAKQTTIHAWIYAAIMLALAFIIVLCVGWRVYKTSRENPANVVKSE